MRIAVVTDTHLCPAGTPPAAWHNPYDFAGAEARLRRALVYLAEHDVALIAMLGDLVNGGDVASVRRGLGLLAAGWMPVRIVPGNHDCQQAVDRLTTEVERAGVEQVRLLTVAGERLGGVRLVGLPIVGVDGDRCVVAWPPVAEWGAEPVILLSHSPVLSREEATLRAGLKYAGGFAGCDGIAAALLARRGPTVVIHGHLHIRDAVAVGPVLQIGCASLIEPPHELALVDVDADDGALAVRVAHHAVAPSPAVRLPVLSAASGAWRFAAGGWTETA